MADHTRNALGAAKKALTDVVAGSLDPDDPLAAEQLRLVVAYVGFVADRAELLHSRARFELRHTVDMATRVLELLPDDREALAGRLETAVRDGRARLDQPAAPTAELRRARVVIDVGLRETVRAAAEMAPSDGRAIERCVLEASGERITMERAWYLPMGLEPRAAEVPPVEEILHAR